MTGRLPANTTPRCAISTSSSSAISLRRFLPSLVNLYRISSGYGQRYLRAGAVLVLLLLVFCSTHLVLGLVPTANNRDYSTMKYRLGDITANSEAFLADIPITAVYTIEVLIREEEPDRLFRPMSTRGDALNSVFSLLIYLQAIFFALAVRRHFKR